MGTAKVFYLTFAVPIISHILFCKKMHFSFTNSKIMINFAALHQDTRRDCIMFNYIKKYGNEKMDSRDGLDGHCMHECTECA